MGSEAFSGCFPFHGAAGWMREACSAACSFSSTFFFISLEPPSVGSHVLFYFIITSL